LIGGENIIYRAKEDYMIRSFNGKTPRIAASAWVSETAYVVGDVEIGENSSIWPGTVIRGDMASIVIGKNTNVQDGSVIHAGSPTRPPGDSFIGDNVQIGHGAVINCHRIGNNTLIGMNATVLHDTEIGSFCIIGAGCVVMQGMKVPDRSFVVGVPGVIQGQSSERQLMWTNDGPQVYAKLAKQFKDQGL
jgi:carbonic anhydrase/acetyltransferase-like protein (isoleucine patch superfamily)